MKKKGEVDEMCKRRGRGAKRKMKKRMGLWWRQRKWVNEIEDKKEGEEREEKLLEFLTKTVINF